jgi:hypothetical protein
MDVSSREKSKPLGFCSSLAWSQLKSMRAVFFIATTNPIHAAEKKDIID